MTVAGSVPLPSERVANLVIAGVGKSGTSSMFSYLAAHPEICGTAVKETHFFDPVLRGEPLPPLEEYARHWAHAAGERYRLEATPLYCLGGDPMLDAFAAHLPPDLRVLILLREPVDRLAVNFAYMKAKLALPDIETFDEYVDRCLTLRDQGIDGDPATGATGWARSFYGDYLGPWIERLGPRLRLVWFDDLVADPEACVRDVLAWLDLDPSPAAEVDYRVHNPTTAPRSRLVQRAVVAVHHRAGAALAARPGLRRRARAAYLRLNGRPNEQPTVSAEARTRLDEALAPSNARLADLATQAGYRDLPPWLRADQGAPASGPST
jgi:hypothetical protein